MQLTEEWLAFVREELRADFTAGELWWAKYRPGRRICRPLGHKSAQGYVSVTINYQRTYVHSILFYLYYGWWAAEIDHIDQNPANNKIENLRAVTHSENLLNSKRRRVG